MINAIADNLDGIAEGQLTLQDGRRARVSQRRFRISQIDVAGKVATDQGALAVLQLGIAIVFLLASVY